MKQRAMKHQSMNAGENENPKKEPQRPDEVPHQPEEIPNAPPREVPGTPPPTELDRERAENEGMIAPTGESKIVRG